MNRIPDPFRSRKCGKTITKISGILHEMGDSGISSIVSASGETVEVVEWAMRQGIKWGWARRTSNRHSAEKTFAPLTNAQNPKGKS